MDPLPPDPYAALNVSRSASAGEIKTAYRKLALKFHPDKAPDKAEEFHKIQQAYELIGEDEPRRKYEDQLRFAELKKNISQRRGSAQGPNINVKTAAFDVRTSSYPGTGFQARGPARYEERRPPGTSAASTPRSPYAEEERSDSYFPQRSASRKYEGADASPRRGPTARPPKAAPRSEEVRETLRKQEKFESNKSRNEKKKQRAQEKGRERKSKFFTSVESEDSEEGYSDPPPPPRRASRQEETPRTRSDDEYYHDQKAQEQSNTARGYMNRAKTEAASMDRGSPPPPAASSRRRASVQHDIPLRARSSSEQEPELRRGADRPVLVRKSPSKTKGAEPFQNDKKASGKESRLNTGDRRTPEPSLPTSERRTPPLTTSNSSPSSIKIPKNRSSDEYEPRGGVPRFERSSTMPAQQPQTFSRTTNQKQDTKPANPSGLRHTETNDSGYSTGTSPNNTPQASYPTSMRYTYGTETVSVEQGPEYSSVLREPNRQRRSPSPLQEPPPPRRERPSSVRERERDKERDRDRGAPPPTRTGSYQQRSSPEADRSGRRPSLGGRTSSTGRVPSFQRSATSPMPTSLQTGVSAKDGLLFGEVPPVASPTDFREFDWGSSNANVRRTYDDVKFSPRISSDNIKYSDDIKFSFRQPPGASRPGRRGSEELRRSPHYMGEERRSRSGVATPG